MRRGGEVRDRAAGILDAVASIVVKDDPSGNRWASHYYSNHRARLIDDLRLIRDLVPHDAEVVEFGSVPPFLTAALSELDIAITGVDIAPGRFADSIMTYGLDIVECDIESEALPFEEGTFTCAIFNELFEHLRINPIFTMQEVHRVLRPGGRLLLTTPNLRSLRGIYHFLVEGRAYAVVEGVYSEYEKLATLGHMGHVREYTPREISEFLMRTGFSIDGLMFRGPLRHWFEKVICSAVPSLSPYMTILATKSSA